MLRYLNTVKYFSINQIFYLFFKNLIRYFSIVILKKKNFLNVKSKRIKFSFFILRYQNDFTKKINKINKKFGKKIWKKNFNKLFTYNIHYLDFIFDHSKNDSKKIIYSWIDENELSYKDIAWDPYPTSLRLINLIKWSIKYNYLSKKLLETLIIHTNFIMMNMEYHLRGNHLFINYKALIFSFSLLENNFHKKIKEKIYLNFNNELENQILNDGGHFEQSPMYHNQFVYDLLDIIQLKCSRLNREKLLVKIDKMLLWSSIMNHNDQVPFFNDSCINVQPSYSDLYNYANKLNLDLKYIKKKRRKLYFFKDSGYIVYINKKYKVIFRSGGIASDYIPAHQHANITSLEISNKFNKIITNSGISTYENLEKRVIERGTMKQSTLSVNKTNMLDVWKSFRVGKRPKVNSLITYNQDKTTQFISEHDGFSFDYFNNIIHKRKITCNENYIEIEDLLEGSGIVKVYNNLFLERFTKIKRNDNLIKTYSKSNTTIELQNNTKYRIKNSIINYNFFKKDKNKNIQIQKITNLPYKETIKILF